MNAAAKEALQEELHNLLAGMELGDAMDALRQALELLMAGVSPHNTPTSGLEGRGAGIDSKKEGA